MKHHSLVVDFSNLDFEKIDTEILVDKAKELEETTIVATVRGTDIAEVRSLDLGQKDGAAAPIAEWFPFFLFLNSGCPLILGLLNLFLNTGCLFILRLLFNCISRLEINNSFWMCILIKFLYVELFWIGWDLLAGDSTLLANSWFIFRDFRLVYGVCILRSNLLLAE